MPRVVYLCKYCDAQFETEPEAAACEESHPLGQEFSVVAVSGYDRLWPEMVEISNGDQTATYTLWVERSKKAPGWLDPAGKPIEAAPAEPGEEEKV